MSGPLSDLDGELGVEARRLVAALCPLPRELESVEIIVARCASRRPLPADLAALRCCVENALTRTSMIGLMAPRGDQTGEHVSGRPEPLP